MISLRRFLVAAVLALVTLVANAQSIDVNTATAAELEALPGIGPTKANAIIAYREQNGPFQSVDDLTKVSGIGDKTLQAIRDQITVGAPAAESSAGSTEPAAGEPAKPAQ